MTELNIERINELARKQKAEGLTEAEKAEQAELRKDYILAIRRSLRGQLESISIENRDGSITNLKEQHDKKYGESEY